MRNVRKSEGLCASKCRNFLTDCGITISFGFMNSNIPSLPTPVSGLPARILSVCNYIQKVGLSPKKFIHGFITLNQSDLIYRRRLMRAGVGERETVEILEGFGDMLRGSPEGSDIWMDFILEQASAIVNAQNAPVGAYPQGLYVSSNSISEDFFTQHAEERRENIVKGSMPFLHKLILRKLQSSLELTETTDEDFDHNVDQDITSTAPASTNGNPDSISDVADEATILSLDNLVYVSKRGAGLKDHKLKMAFKKAMAAAADWPVEMSMFIPTPDQITHWKGVILAQLADVLKTYVEHLPGDNAVKLPVLKTQPASIDPIQIYQPNIFFLRLMDAPDSSAEGVSQALEEVMSQIGVDVDEFAKGLLFAEGDVGSNELVESLRRKHFPSSNMEDLLRWIVTVFGPAHATWNMCKALCSKHWGDSKDGQDTGAWQTVEALGGTAKHPSQQDFNTLMMMTKKSHDASLFFVLTHELYSWLIKTRTMAST
ncbi:uncharacterized protein MELLADRAFT_110677 [Melampsora larici-populina 98AG31]|uniref:DUF6589 domain-containing protein n=1 Tax=Melampsora larici-populina (strain 98AG31 / pathotype 3-4-7) TaxID=747676 RepID=F4S0L0_MELLP|nr:uncharacterized protein MELLADRAFT_110677 [Melampsora larici-populina 98AG31]EGG01848.1 hypothetical protein MELLADRAFT_110677 [Melampsora larici-populina 98AG31]